MTPCIQVADPWKLAEDMMIQGVVVEGTITGCNKRGIYVQLADLKGVAGGKPRLSTAGSSSCEAAGRRRGSGV
jgi:ribosomal protein S1